MNFFTRLLSLAAVPFIAVSAASALPAGTGFDATSHFSTLRTGKAADRALRTESIDRINTILADSEKPQASVLRANAAGSDIKIEPVASFSSSESFGDIDGPDGKVWFYTMDFENEEIKHEFFTEYRLQAFTIKIYDENQKLIETIHDRIDYAEDEDKVPGCNLLPVITKNFFNDDDKYEIVLGLAINTNTPGVLHYRSAIYQIGGEKDSDGDHKIVSTLPEMVCDVLDASTPGGPEKIFMTTMSELFPEDFPENGDMWEYRLASKVRLQVYAKATNGKAPASILEYDICHQNLPGNQETTPFLISLADNGNAYIVFSQYKETLFEPYYDSNDELEQRASNALKIDIFELGSTAKKVQETEIAFTKDSAEGNLASFYSIGDCLYRKDINFHDYDNSGKASFIVTKGNKTVASDELLESSYYLYGPDGSLKKTVFENSQSMLSLSDIKGHEPQAMFVTMRDNEFVFNFVDMISCKQVAKIKQYLQVDGSDPDPLLANLDRTAEGSSYRYAAEMRYPTEEDDCSFMRIAWFDADGTYSHTDEVNMGKSVHYAKCLIDGSTLLSDTFLSDARREYAMLIKRGTDNNTIEEFLIGQARSEEYPDGRDVLFITPGDKGVIETILPYSMSGLPLLAIAYYNDGFHQIEFYSLPFDGKQSGIGSTIAGSEGGNISLEGSVILAPGCVVELFSIQGIRLASAADRLDISGYSAGTYIVKAGDSAKKIIKK